MQIKVIPVTAFQQNCSILICDETNKAAVIDPGGDLDVILARLKETGATPEKILITHGHIDHAGATAELAEILRVPVEGPHKDEKGLIDSIAQQGSMFGLQGKVFSPDRWLKDNDTVTVGNQTLEVIHCPGHTLGHIVFYNPKQRFAVVGDVIFKGSIGRTDLPGGNHQSLVDSIRNKLFPLGDDIQFLPGHGPLSTFGAERQTNPYVGDRAV